MARNIVDDILSTGNDDEMRKFISEFNDQFELGEVVNVPDKLLNFGINLIQDDDYTISIHANDKLHLIEPYPISIIRRGQCD